MLNQFMGDPRWSRGKERYAAMSLARSGDARGYTFLKTVAADRRLPKGSRADAMRMLQILKAEGPEVNESIRQLREKAKRWFEAIECDSPLDAAFSERAALAANSKTFALDGRSTAVGKLARFGDAEAVRDLAASAADAHNPLPLRRKAITSLALQGAREALTAIAEDASLESTVRCWASVEAAWLASQRARDVLVALVGDESVDFYTRRKAALVLEQLADPRGTRLLARRATDPAAAPGARGVTIQLLTQLRYTGALTSIISTPKVDDEVQSRAIAILASHGQTVALVSLLPRSDLPPAARRQIADVVQRTRTPKAKGPRR